MYTEYDYNNELYHYGVKGMKWRHRKGFGYNMNEYGALSGHNRSMARMNLRSSARSLVGAKSGGDLRWSKDGAQAARSQYNAAKVLRGANVLSRIYNRIGTVRVKTFKGAKLGSVLNLSRRYK